MAAPSKREFRGTIADEWPVNAVIDLAGILQQPCFSFPVLNGGNDDMTIPEVPA